MWELLLILLVIIILLILFLLTRNNTKENEVTPGWLKPAVVSALAETPPPVRVIMTGLLGRDAQGRSLEYALVDKVISQHLVPLVYGKDVLYVEIPEGANFVEEIQHQIDTGARYFVGATSTLQLESIQHLLEDRLWISTVATFPHSGSNIVRWVTPDTAQSALVLNAQITAALPNQNKFLIINQELTWAVHLAELLTTHNWKIITRDNIPNDALVLYLDDNLGDALDLPVTIILPDFLAFTRFSPEELTKIGDRKIYAYTSWLSDLDYQTAINTYPFSVSPFIANLLHALWLTSDTYLGRSGNPWRNFIDIYGPDLANYFDETGQCKFVDLILTNFTLSEGWEILNKGAAIKGEKEYMLGTFYYE